MCIAMDRYTTTRVGTGLFASSGWWQFSSIVCRLSSACVRQGFETVKEVYGCLDNVAMVTLAPELENACDAVEGLTERGIVVSTG